VTITLWLLPLLLLLLGVLLVVRGMRGRAVDDHPICRRCGFDLFGRPEGSAAI
jgi:cytochrome c-type biogenesis protein CcmH/NrfF